MEKIIVKDILVKMLGVAQDSLGDSWKDAKPYANQEFKSLAENIKLITKLKLEGKISDKQAITYLGMQKNAAKISLLTIEGLGLITVENTINSAIDIIKAPINKLIGFELI